MRYIAINDIHAAHSPTQYRRNALPWILMKLRHVVEQCGSSPLLVAGDWFHSADVSFGTVAEVQHIIQEQGINLFGITGQHDLPLHGKWTKGPAHPLSWGCGDGHTLVEGESGLHIIAEASMEFMVVLLPYGTQYDDNFYETLSELRQPHIIVMHDMLVPSPVPWEHMLIDEFARSLPDTKVPRVVHCGDFHPGYDPIQIGMTTFINPGALTRIKRSDANRIPRYAEILFEDGQFNVAYHDIPHRPGEEMFNMTGYGAERIEASDNVSRFVEEVQAQDVDFVEADLDRVESENPEAVTVVRGAITQARQELGYSD